MKIRERGDISYLVYRETPWDVSFTFVPWEEYSGAPVLTLLSGTRCNRMVCCILRQKKLCPPRREDRAFCSLYSLQCQNAQGEGEGHHHHPHTGAGVQKEGAAVPGAGPVPAEALLGGQPAGGG